MEELHSYSSIFTLGHRGMRALFEGPVFVEEKIDGCVSLDTPILKSDLTYCPAGLLKEGDELIGFDDDLNNPKLRPSYVTVAKPIKKDCIDVNTTEGPITVSKDHPFLIRQITNNNGKLWINAEDLKPGMCIVSVGRWQHESSWESGYLAGQFDGEGSLVKSGNGRILSYYQKTGPELDLVAKLLAARNINFTLDIRKRKENYKEVGAIIVRKPWTGILRFLGTVRPQRLIVKSMDVWNAACLNGIGHATVIAVAKSKTKVVMGLSTSTKTYIANGLLSHNSQFSFGRIQGKLLCRSKGSIIDPLAPPKMFKRAVDTVDELFPFLPEGWVFRGECLDKPKHNALAYDRVPKGNVIIYDIEKAPYDFLSYTAKYAQCAALELECVPCLWMGNLKDLNLDELLNTTSILGSVKIEGFVIKPTSLNVWGEDKKLVIAKYVSPAFKEIHANAWAKGGEFKNHLPKDITTILGDTYRSEARWQKALQHLRDDGKLKGEPQDIPILLKEVPHDILKECSEEIKDKLFAWAMKDLMKSWTRGLPEWYKNKLAEEQKAEVEKEQTV